MKALWRVSKQEIERFRGDDSTAKKLGPQAQAGRELCSTNAALSCRKKKFARLSLAKFVISWIAGEAKPQRTVRRQSRVNTKRPMRASGKNVARMENQNESRGPDNRTLARKSPGLRSNGCKLLRATNFTRRGAVRYVAPQCRQLDFQNSPQ